MHSLRAIIASLTMGCAACAIAQTMPSTQPLAGPTTAPATAPSTQPGGVATTQGGGLILNFKDAPIDAVLDQLSEAARFVVVKETKIEGRVSILSRQPISADDAVSLLNTVLKQNGYAAIQMGRSLKIVSRDKAKKSAIPVRSGNDPQKINATDELITQVIPIRWADAVQLKADLAPLIGSEADLAANASSNSIVVTDTSANIKRLVEIISALDTSLQAAADVKVFQLKYAGAAAAAKLINDVFREDAPSNQNQNPAAAFFRRFGPPGMDAGNTNSQQAPRKQVKINASSDDRTNTLVVSGPADTLQVVARVIKEIDADPSEQDGVFLYPLRNAQAVNLQNVLNNLFNATNTGTTGIRTNTNQNTNRTSSSSGFGSTSTGGRTGAFGSNSAFGTGSGFGTNTNRTAGFGTGFGTGMGGQVSSAVRAAASDLAGQVTIVADADTNSLLIRTAPKNFDRVKQILADLDRAVPQVLIKVLIAEVTHDNSTELGAEFSILNIRASDFGSKGGTDFGLGSATGGLIAKVLEKDFTATVRALETTGKLDVLSRPYILASDNQLASITVGQEVPFITRSQISDTGFTNNTIQYQDVGIILNVTPHINPEGLVILDVAPEISALTGTTVTVSETVKAPVIAKRSAQSRVGIRNGQTIVIGGLMEDRKTDSVSKVPILGDIPLLGLAFRSTEKKISKTELLIFLTPVVAADPRLLKDVSERELKGTQIVPKAVEPGAFQQHLDAMRNSTTQPSE